MSVYVITDEAILNTIAEKARQELSQRGSFMSDFYHETLGQLERRDFFTPLGPAAELDSTTAFIGAMEFETLAANSVVLTDMFNKGIDEFFADPANIHKFGGADNDELDARRQQLKEFVTEKLDLKPETEQAKQFMQDLKTEFDRAVTSNGNERTNERIRFIKDFVTPLKAAVEAMDDPNKKNRQGILNSAGSGLDNRVKRLAFDGLEDKAQQLASERGVISHAVKSVFMPIESDKSVMPHEFLEHYKQEGFIPTAEEAAWAAEVFDRITDGGQVDLSRFMLNKEPFFTEAQINDAPMFQDSLKSKLVGAVLAGDKVSIRKDDGTMALINPQIVDARRENMSFFDKIIDFFKELLGIGKEKEAQLQQDISGLQNNMQSVRDKFEKKATVIPRERITFDELSGTDAIKKVTASQKQNTPEKSKSTPTAGM